MKNYKYLVVNGCSFAKGQGCKNVEEERFSKLLSDKLKCEEINIAKGGGSNDRAFRTTFDWIQENQNKVKESLFIIGLTELYRKDLYSNVRKTYTAISVPELYHEQSDSNEASVKLCMSEDDIKKYADLDLKYLTSDVPLMNNLNRQLILLNSYIKAQGGRLIFFASFSKEERKYTKKTDELEEFMIGGYDTWRKFISSYRDSYKGNHPNSDDHKILSDKLYEYLNE
ncbi:hypothetical protein CMI42_02190 [Candidatus Pacearchaeota archaeon]|jgi:hypothetical protein|nr:hypothetical protein [Candidatus Pacearchaeota archaeon]|tara:strand:+ start:3651 stop:4331 length:681 start_codon:yes stop_codon:yes gene_type:complete